MPQSRFASGLADRRPPNDSGSIRIVTTRKPRRVNCCTAVVQLSLVVGVTAKIVVPRANRAISILSKKIFGIRPFYIDYKKETGLVLGIKNPKELGADRIVNAACAYHYFGKSAIVVDMGTAVTLDCVDKKGCYMGGMIMPGIGIWLRSLSSYTAKLPEVGFAVPSSIIGRTTRDCMKSGAYYGVIGMIEKAVSICKSAMKERPVVILTGGFGGVFFGKIKGVKLLWEDLTLRGLRLLWMINKK